MRRYLRIATSATMVFGFALVNIGATPLGVSSASAAPAPSTSVDFGCPNLSLFGYQTTKTSTTTTGSSTTTNTFGSWSGVWNGSGESLIRVHGLFVETVTGAIATELFMSSGGYLLQTSSDGTVTTVYAVSGFWTNFGISVSNPC